MNEREVPYSREAEIWVLGGIFLANHLFDDVAELIGEKDFFCLDHQVIWRAIADLAQTRQPVDVVTVTEYLRQRDLMAEAGGPVAIMSIAADVPSAANIRAHAEIVRDKAVMRAMIAAGGDIAELGFRPGEKSSRELIDSAQQAVLSIGQRSDGSAPETIGSLAGQFYNELENRIKNKVSGLATGLTELDNKLGGLQPSDLVIVAGRPSMGKTALALNIADFVSEEKSVLVFSMEMSKEQVTGRILSPIAKVPVSLMRSPMDITQAQHDQLVSAVQVASNRKMHVDDRGGLTVLQLSSKARRVHRKTPLSLIVVDYIQLMTGKGGNRNEEVNEITRGLKALAKELSCVVVALSQLNRGVESRDNKRPRMSDLRESGGIEQDADIIVSMYRDEYYHPEGPHAGVAEAGILKNRNGATGSVELSWNGPLCLFSNYFGPSFAQREPKKEDRPKRGFKKPLTPFERVMQ